MRDTTTAEVLLEELARGCPLPPEEQVRATYRPVEVCDGTGWTWPGTVTGWWTSPEGSTTCWLRLSGCASPRWVVFDSDRIALLVQGGT
ncbi:hypothetical protein ACIQCF_09110 [Streptomyces sp. NPDC088353]|uniref:hypothetical protein n=1 Tax=Streptomyces sp. NPDC088353 TaxID=3365855 RepID=UPI0038269E36